MRDYTYQEMMKMQEDAVRRVREMKKRSAFAAEDAQNTLNSDMKKTGVFLQTPAEQKEYLSPWNMTGVTVIFLQTKTDRRVKLLSVKDLRIIYGTIPTRC